jgi:hypothetical protein
MKRAIFFVLVIVTGYRLSAQNLVTNPGFENWESPSTPSGWTTAQNCESNTLNIVSGTYSCKHSGTLTDRSDLSQTIPVTSGKDYYLSYYCRTEVSGTGSGARIWCYWKDNTGAEIRGDVSEAVLKPTKYTKNETFQQYSLTVTAPAGAVSFNLEFRTYKNSSAWWDDIFFGEYIPTGVSAEDAESLIIYPNPASNYLNIKYLHGLQHIDIQNITGTVVYSQKYSGENEITIPLTDMAEGVYFIIITLNDKVSVQRFIKRNR